MTLSVERDLPPDRVEQEIAPSLDTSFLLAGRSWVWLPEGSSAQDTPPGTGCFRKQLVISQEDKSNRGVFFGTADDGLTLFAQDKRDVENAAEWRSSTEPDVTALLHPGTNQLVFWVTNDGDQPSPVGLISKPFRLNVTRWVKSSTNNIYIDPFAPKAVQNNSHRCPEE